MRLYLAVATLMLVLLAHSEASEEVTFQQHFANFQERAKQFGDVITEKTLSTLKEIEKNEFVNKAKNWLSEQADKAKKTFEEAFNKPQ